MKRYFNSNTKVNSFDVLREGFKNEATGLLIGGILAPISLFLGVMTLGVLVLIAFGKVDYWGSGGRIIVGILVPSIIILSLLNKKIGNIIFTIWSLILTIILFIIPVGLILYHMGLKPVFQYLNF